MGSRAFAHKAGLHTQRHRPGPRRLRAHRARRRRQRHPLRRFGAGRPVDGGHAGPGPRASTSTDEQLSDVTRAAEDAGARRLPLRGGRRLARAAAADGLRAGTRTSSGSSASGSSSRQQADGSLLDTRPRSRCGSKGERVIATAEGNGPVNALDQALRKAIGQAHPALSRIHLTDYKVRVLDTAQGHGRRHPGPARLHRRGTVVEHHRRVGEHHRGVVAGAVRLHRPRPARRRDVGAVGE